MIEAKLCPVCKGRGTLPAFVGHDTWSVGKVSICGYCNGLQVVPCDSILDVGDPPESGFTRR